MLFVYPLGTGSVWTDLELKFSIQSIKKYSIEPVSFLVIGEIPRCELPRDVRFVQYTPRHNNRMIDVLLKLQYIFSHKLFEYNKDFCIMSDDIFALKPFKPSELKNCYWKTIGERLEEKKGDGQWRMYQANAGDKDDLCFSTHRPFPVRYKGLFLTSIIECVNRIADPFTYYGNLIYKNDVSLCEEKKNTKINNHTLNWYNDNIDWLSIGDKFLLPQNKEKLYKLLKCEE
jgi:hypothetical protein